ncbi:DUF1127 domain-containing protein [Bosea sp. 47.2.35]|uniref:DUF1127 domain-containing protein n=1 Tax=Bosea sp. 47.2.35 TaxID=2969304 RepID=UPI00214F787C|nr:DUF1127 domain-containing protein [Bosea sp. 47.2.35]MCR4520045.1 DUF1127 domain-containing protein [Bosea sp. 47.2.35]
MSAVLPIITRPVSTKRSEALLRLPGALYQAASRYFVNRAAIADLYEFDEHALHDIGIARSQIEAAVHGLVPRPDRKPM